MSEPLRIEVAIDTVRRLIAAQFPQWRTLELRPVAATGTDNAMFRLGPELAVRLPRVDWAVASLEKEVAWLPKLAPHLPRPVPVPLARGAPGEGYPWAWSVCRWIAGQTVVGGELPGEAAFARELGAFLRALWRLDAADGPAPGRHNFGRGVALSRRDQATRVSISALGGEFDPAALAAVWEQALAAPEWNRPPVWIHGDLQATNLLARNGRLAGVIDFGGLGVGDPACDLMVAWSLFSPSGRLAFREAAALDADAWTRGRGWALSAAVIALAYYRERLPAVARAARRTLEAVLADPEP